MDWVFAGIVIVTIVVVWAAFSRSKSRFQAGKWELERTRNEQAYDRSYYLQTLRRELANYLIWKDPQRYLATYKSLRTELELMASWRPEKIVERIGELQKKYRDYLDFDLINTREFILYMDTLNDGYSVEEVERRYRDIINYEALLSVVDESWKYMGPHIASERELNHYRLAPVGFSMWFSRY